jgi:hypothetical protein
VFATVLRLPGAAAGAVLTAASEEKSLGPAESSLSVMCEITGGRCVAVTGMRALLQNMVRAAALQRERESGPGGLTREVETPLPSNSPHDHMILRGDLVGSHGRWKRPCLQTAHMTI